MKISRREFIELGSLAGLNLILDSCGPSRRLPDVALVSIDTLRADYFSPEFMPKTYKWAQKNCQIFTNAYANSTWTLPSHATMLTGLLPEEHGVELKNSRIPDHIPMIQEGLRDRGYRTFGFTDGGFVGKSFGFSRGFEDYIPRQSRRMEEAAKIFSRFHCQPLGKIAAEAEKLKSPKFLFIHTFKVHHYLIKTKQVTTAASRKKVPNQECRRLYEENLRQFDTEFEDFVSRITNKNLKMIITSDHGEGFGEVYEENIGHGGKPYKEQTRIPLIVYGNGRGIFEHLTDLTRIGATLESFAGSAKTDTIYQKADEAVSTTVSELNIRYNARITLDSHTFSDEPYVPMNGEKIDLKKNEHLKRELEALGYL
jgi:arylsulfatase A-like enzyme